MPLTTQQFPLSTIKSVVSLITLESIGELDNTLIVYTSDHGELLGDYDCYGKRSFLDPAARIPLLVRYPERFEAGAQCDIPTSLVDVLPTSLAAAGLPEQDDRDGVDLAAIANGDTQRDAIVGQFGQETQVCTMLLTDEYKYIYSAADRQEWLIRRLPSRLDERNLAGNPASGRVLSDYRKRLIEWFRNDGYELPLDGNRWREFPPPSESENPDAGQLFQDGRSVSDQFPEGYSPMVDTLRRKVVGLNLSCQWTFNALYHANPSFYQAVILKSGVARLQHL